MGANAHTVQLNGMNSCASQQACDGVAHLMKSLKVTVSVLPLVWKLTTNDCQELEGINCDVEVRSGATLSALSHMRMGTCLQTKLANAQRTRANKPQNSDSNNVRRRNDECGPLSGIGVDELHECCANSDGA